ncbi:MAG: S-layer homology domain-containing protein [Armatimonadota bacterium]
MSKWIAGVSILAALLASPSQAAFQRPYDKVFPSTPAYGAIQQLEGNGLFTGYPAGSFAGKRALTRYDFAVATERLHRELQPKVASAETPGRLRQDLEALRVLMDEFGPDMVALGQDLEELERQFEQMRERVTRLDAAAQAPSASDSPNSEEILAAALSRPRLYGVRNALRNARRNSLLSVTRADTPLKGPAALTSAAAFTGSVGPASVSVGIEGPDRLHNDPSLPLQDPSTALDYHAQLDLPFGSYTLSAFYSRAAGMWDYYGLSGLTMPAGPVEEVGGALTRELGNRLDLQLATASISSLDDDLARMVYWKGMLHYDLGRGFFIGLGYERTRQLGIPGLALDSAAYTLRIDRSLGDVQLGLLIRRHDTPGSSGSDLRNASAITQINVRF